MEPTINEKTRIVAKYQYPKMLCCNEVPNFYVLTDGLFYDGTYAKDLHLFHYSTNIATLWPVAKRTMTELEQIRKGAHSQGEYDKCLKFCEEIDATMTAINKANNTFDTLQLFNAVYSAIMLLKKYNNGTI